MMYGVDAKPSLVIFLCSGLYISLEVILESDIKVEFQLSAYDMFDFM